MIRIENLTVGFNLATPTEKIVLKNFNLEINDNDFIVILGSNGAGKSTLFNAILGTISYSGNIYFDDKIINDIPLYKRAKDIGIVYQDPLSGTAPNLKVFENILLSTKGKVSFLKKDEYRKKALQEVASYGLGLEKQFDYKANQLSGGQRQALTLFMATNASPKLLLLDEHTAALDPNTQEKIMEITNKIVTSKKITTLMITHNLKTALKYGNRLIILNEGKIVVDIKDEAKASMNEAKLMELYSTSFSDKTLFKER